MPKRKPKGQRFRLLHVEEGKETRSEVFRMNTVAEAMAYARSGATDVVSESTENTGLLTVRYLCIKMSGGRRRILEAFPE